MDNPFDSSSNERGVDYGSSLYYFENECEILEEWGDDVLEDDEYEFKFSYETTFEYVVLLVLFVTNVSLLCIWLIIIFLFQASFSICIIFP